MKSKNNGLGKISQFCNEMCKGKISRFCNKMCSIHSNRLQQLLSAQ